MEARRRAQGTLEGAGVPHTFSAGPGAAGAAAPPGAGRVLPEPLALWPHAGPEEVVLVLRAGGWWGRGLWAARRS